VPVKKGVYSFCWVVGHAEKMQWWNKRQKRAVEVDVITIALASWFGEAPPTAEDLSKPNVLAPKHPGSIYKIVVTKTPLLPPKAYTPIGRVKTVGKHTANGYHGWPLMLIQAKAEWAFRADAKGFVDRMEATERARLANNAANDKKRAAVDAKKKALIKTRTVADWARAKDLLAELDGMMSKKRAAELIVIVRKHARILAEASDRKAKLAVLAALTVDINRWDARVGPGVIETAEREVLSLMIDQLGHAAGLRGQNFAEDLRDW